MTQSPDSVDATLRVPSPVPLGAAVRARLRIHNRGGATVDLYLRGREPTFDLTVSDPGGAVVWRRLEGQVLPSILQLLPLAPGESLDLTADWDQRSARGTAVPPGRYTFQAALLLEDGTLDAPPVNLTINGERE